MKQNIIIITDLDGTLLDAKTYSFTEAIPALELIKKRGIPLVICSSKTRAEIEVYRKRLNNVDPFISENGGGIYYPKDYFPSNESGEQQDGYEVVTLGSQYEKIRKRFTAMRERLGIKVRGFGDMSTEEVASLTGLSLEEAGLAKQRDFEEPFIFLDKADDRFFREIEGEGLRWTQGRFFHFMGDHHKGRAVNILRKLYEQRDGAVRTVGIGDSLNDLPFLLAVDLPVLVRKEDGTYDERVDIPRLVRANGVGPAGWSETVIGLLIADRDTH